MLLLPLLLPLLTCGYVQRKAKEATRLVLRLSESKARALMRQLCQWWCQLCFVSQYFDVWRRLIADSPLTRKIFRFTRKSTSSTNHFLSSGQPNRPIFSLLCSPTWRMKKQSTHPSVIKMVTIKSFSTRMSFLLSKKNVENACFGRTCWWPICYTNLFSTQKPFSAKTFWLK